MRNERSLLLRNIIEQLDERDREILALRHFEQLTNGEAAEVLNVTKTTASNRYVRALKRLRGCLDTHQVLSEERTSD
jgi:RNA polymerase sigma-70 factor (ECF subfamily)